MEVQPRLPRAFSRLLLEMELQGQSLVHSLVGSPVLGGERCVSKLLVVYFEGGIARLSLWT